MANPTSETISPLTQTEIDGVVNDLLHLAQHTSMSVPTRDKIRAITARLQAGRVLFGLVKFADGTSGCHTCGVRADAMGNVNHVPRYHTND